MNSITSALLIMLKPFYFVHLTDSYFNSFCLLEQQHPDKRTMTKGFKKGSFPSGYPQFSGAPFAVSSSPFNAGPFPRAAFPFIRGSFPVENVPFDKRAFPGGFSQFSGGLVSDGNLPFPGGSTLFNAVMFPFSSKVSPTFSFPVVNGLRLKPQVVLQAPKKSTSSGAQVSCNVQPNPWSLSINVAVQ